MKTFLHLFGSFLIMACLGSYTYHPASAQEVAPAGKTYPKNPEFDKLKSFSLAEILNELEARGAMPKRTSRRGPPQLNPALAKFDTPLLRGKAIIDFDNRKEIFNIPNPKEKANADTILGIFTESQLEKSSNTWKLKENNGVFDHMPGTNKPLCRDTRFKGQPLGPFGTAVAVRPHFIVTANHNLNNIDPKELLFIFGYRMNSNNTAVKSFPAKEVFHCEKVIKSKVNPDLCFIKVKEEIPPSRISKVTSISIDRGAVYNIGHPLCLPAKHADNANIRRSDEKSFWADLDAFRGNSGSPVFLKNSDVVVGIIADTRDPEQYCFGESGEPPNCCKPNLLTRLEASLERCLKVNDQLIAQELDGRNR
jgi:hypothetical protein